jgi:bacterial/archaeal transporter family-2 protein
MDRGLAVVVTAVAGGLIALQPPINSVFGKAIGTLQASTISFLIGTIALALLTLTVGGGFGDLGEIRHIGIVYLAGGLLGAIYVTTVLVTVRHLGAGGVTAATIAGQLTLSVVIDQLGILGVEKQPINAAKVLGIVLLAAGTFFIVRD